MKRWRTPKAKEGQLLARWGKLRHASPDLVFAWGHGVPKCDASLLYGVFGAKQVRIAFNDEDRKKSGGRSYYFDKTLAEELTERGYDITTLRFSIERKKP